MRNAATFLVLACLLLRDARPTGATSPLSPVDENVMGERTPRPVASADSPATESPSSKRSRLIDDLRNGSEELVYFLARGVCADLDNREAFELLAGVLVSGAREPIGVLEALATLRPDKTFDVRGIQPFLSHANRDIRAAASRALGAICRGGGAKDAEPLYAAIEFESDEHAAGAFVLAIARIAPGEQRTRDLVAAKMMHPSILIRDAAVESLGYLDSNHPSVAEMCADALRRDETFVLALGAVGRQGPAMASCVDILLDRLNDGSLKDERLADGGYNVRCQAVMALAAMRVDSAAVRQALLRALRDPAWSVRKDAARAIAILHPVSDDIAAALQKALRDEECAVRLNAAVAIARCGGGTDAIVRAFREVVHARPPDNDENSEHTVTIAEQEICAGLQAVYYAQAPIAEIVDTLVECLAQRQASIRGQSCFLLCSSGEAGAPALPALMALTDDSDARVRRAAARAHDAILRACAVAEEATSTDR